jgi:hypothetical protein
VTAVLLDHFRRFTLAYLLAGLFFCISSGTQFVDTFVTLTREQAATLAWWQILALFWKSILSGLGAVLAFLNPHAAKIPPSDLPPKL